LLPRILLNILSPLLLGFDQKNRKTKAILFAVKTVALKAIWPIWNPVAWQDKQCQIQKNQQYQETIAYQGFRCRLYLKLSNVRYV